MAVEGIIRHQFVHFRAADLDKLCLTGRGRFLVEGRGVAHQPEERVNFVVAQRPRGFGGFHLRSQFEVVIAVAERLPHHIPGRLGAGAGIADVDALARQIVNVLDAGIGAGDDADRFGVNRKHRAQFLERAGGDERFLAGAVVGVILPVRLGHAHVKFTAADGVNVIHRPAGGLHRTADAVFFASLVDEPANGSAGRIIDAGYAAGADGDKSLLGGVDGCDEYTAERQPGGE